MRFDLALACQCAMNIEKMQCESPAFSVMDNILLFRGTVGMRELWTEMRVGSSEWSGGGNIHRGFADVYNDLRMDLYDLLEYPRVDTVAGHSLGGVLAVLFADDMRRSNKVSPTVYTFGAPRIGDAVFSKSIDSSQIFRIYNTGDPVTRVPPLCGHIGRPIKLTFPGNGLERHSLDKYIKALNKSIK